MDNHGDLKFGDIPAPLQYSRPHQVTTLENGITVVSEPSANSTSYIGVYVGAGSRNEELSASGTSYLLQKMLARGTTSLSKTEFSETVASMGATYSGVSEREHTHFGLKVQKGDCGRAVALLGDAICNPAMNSAEFSLLKDEVSAELETSHTRYEETTLEACHFNVFREHMMGQPIKGDRDINQEIQLDDLRNYMSANYYGDNTVIVATGEVDHKQVVEAVEQAFASMPKSTDVPTLGTERPIYIPAILMMRDDEMINSNVGIFYDAPSAKDEDFYAFQVLKNMFGSYRIDQNAEHLNDVHKQYNSMHALLGNLPDVTKADAHYKAYSDCGIFGNYFFGNEVFTRQMNYCGVCLPTIYSHYLNEVEVIRGRNNMYNQLMNQETVEDLNQEIGSNFLLYGRRVTRTEVANRIANVDAFMIKKLANKWFYDAEPSFTNWGPIEQVSSVGSYKYFKINTMSTITNAHHTLFN